MSQPTSISFRALCAELVSIVQHHAPAHIYDLPYEAAAMQRARDALAQPEPQGPSDEEILALSQWHEVSYTLSDGRVLYPLQEGTDMKDAVLSFTRAVLARWRRPVIEPVPVIPTEEQRLAANAITDENGKRWDRTMDAVLWAKAFCILYPNNDEANMLGWFANAIMSGWDHHAWRSSPETEDQPVAELEQGLPTNQED